MDGVSVRPSVRGRLLEHERGLLEQRVDAGLGGEQRRIHGHESAAAMLAIDPPAEQIDVDLQPPPADRAPLLEKHLRGPRRGCIRPVVVIV